MLTTSKLVRNLAVAIPATAVLLMPSALPAQLTSVIPQTSVRTNQSLVGVGVGNGMVQGQKVATVESKGQPAVGLSALSSGPVAGNSSHFGSKGSVSVANNERLLGLDGAGGTNSPNSVSVENPRHAPVLSGTPH